jgi:tryptophanyl-tRNA synthetase
MRQRVFSGVQPTADSIHLGNYLGAVRGMLALQDEHDCIFAVVDYHAITMPYDPACLPARVLGVATEYLAAGLDPERAALIVQSDVPEHVELAWLLGAGLPEAKLEQLPSYKDKKARTGTASAGLLCYPLLMAADILIYKAELVPVGRDNVPHVELTREVARLFNRTYGNTFPEPQERLNEAATVPGLDGGGAMSKSVPGSYIALSDTPEEIRHKLNRAVTDPARQRRRDPGEPSRCNVYTIHGLYTPTARLEELARGCRSGQIGCLECKAVLAGEIIADLAPLQARRAELVAHPDTVHDVLQEGARRVRPQAQATVAEVRAKMGIGLGRPLYEVRGAA